jgi:hypothetical protein
MKETFYFEKNVTKAWYFRVPQALRIHILGFLIIEPHSSGCSWWYYVIKTVEKPQSTSTFWLESHAFVPAQDYAIMVVLPLFDSFYFDAFCLDPCKNPFPLKYKSQGHSEAPSRRNNWGKNNTQVSNPITSVMSVLH